MELERMVLAAHVDGVDAPSDPVPQRNRTERALFGETNAGVALPPLPDLLTALLALATGRQSKALVALADIPVEIALVRCAGDVLVSAYETGAVPEVFVLDRRVAMTRLLESCAHDLAVEAERASSDTARSVAERLALRACGVEMVDAPSTHSRVLERAGGVLDEPSDDVSLAFGFRARIPTLPSAVSEGSSRADVHALLFSGELWAWVRGHRVSLMRGPIMLAVSRMVAAVRILVDAWDADRRASFRLNAASFSIGVRLDTEVALTFGSERDGLTIAALEVPEAALPILRLASDLLRALVAVDRGQSRNIKVRLLREEVRALRKRVRARTRKDGFVNDDADRLRAAHAGEHTASTTGSHVALAPTGNLRFAERWTVEVDELDASSTFLCGDRLVIATPRRAIAVSREDGAVLWAREGFGGSSHMAGTTLIRLAPAGDVELCSVIDGEPFATTRVGPGFGAHVRAVHVAGPSVPPVVVLPDGPSRIVAVDLRNGEHRFGYAAKGPGPIRLKRAGRLLLVTSGDGSIDAIDVASSEVVWRFHERVRFCHEPTVVGDVVIAVAGEPGGQRGVLFGIDLYSGELRHRRELPAAPSAPPIAAGKDVIVAIGGRRRGSIACVQAELGELRWMAPDIGIGGGGAALALDRALVVNAPAGRIAALDLDDGSARWSRVLSDAVADDVPRRLEPVVRGGALFAPAASVHVLRPTDGAPLGAALPCSLVPDLVRVDERGWVYVGEESGQLSAYAPVPHLSLVR